MQSTVVDEEQKKVSSHAYLAQSRLYDSVERPDDFFGWYRHYADCFSIAGLGYQSFGGSGWVGWWIGCVAVFAFEFDGGCVDRSLEPQAGDDSL